MTNVDALKALYKALGGDAASVAGITTTAEMIDAITAIIADAIKAAALPEVTTENNGAVLKVVGGEWAIGTDAT